VLSRRAAPDPGQVPLRRPAGAMRRLASAALVATAVAVGLFTVSGKAPAGSTALLASHDLAAGAMLGADDVDVVSRPAGQLPSGALGTSGEVVGRVLASAARKGEVLTDVRLVGPALVDSLAPGQVAIPVRVADAAAAALVRPGDHVDVLVAVEGTAAAQTVVTAATVLTRPDVTGAGGLLEASSDDGRGGLVVLGVLRQDAGPLAGAAALGPLSLTLRGS
jgi:pilus assembly protein CpaB